MFGKARPMTFTLRLALPDFFLIQRGLMLENDEKAARLSCAAESTIVKPDAEETEGCNWQGVAIRIK